jgi:tRNA-splicing ligase RtcB
MFVIYEMGQKVPIKVWLKDKADLEPGCLEQATNISKHPIIFHHASLMPDCHKGYGVPIGSVIACKNAVIPNAVGVDIGCGMGYIKTSIPANIVKQAKGVNDVPLLREIIRTIDRVIPTGFSHNKDPQEWIGFDNAPDIPIIQQELNSARYQLGTLGGGNHFIEFQESNDGYFAIMLHSGSRNFGYQICKIYNEMAKELNEKWHSAVIPEWDLAFLPTDSQEGHEYITAMNYALLFAQENRHRMLERVKNITFNYIDKYIGQIKKDTLREVNIHHNYASLENHFGQNVWVHRKGAIKLLPDDIGIIPGSMGTASYIVKGMDGPNSRDSFWSASHGAGRRMGRAEASRQITLGEANKSMDGIYFNGWGKVERGKEEGNPDFGEAPGAYKDIDAVIMNENDLISVEEKLKPIAVVKA